MNAPFCPLWLMLTDTYGSIISGWLAAARWGNRTCATGFGLPQAHQRACAGGQGPGPGGVPARCCFKAAPRVVLAKALLQPLRISRQQADWWVGPRWPGRPGRHIWPILAGVARAARPWPPACGIALGLCRRWRLACFGPVSGHPDGQPDVSLSSVVAALSLPAVDGSQLHGTPGTGRGPAYSGPGVLTTVSWWLWRHRANLRAP